MDIAAIESSLDLRRHRISVTPTIRKRKRHQSNIWVFDSPKINKRFTVLGDVAFMHLVLLEGDTSVLGYDPTPAPILSVANGEPYQTTLDAIVHFESGRDEWWEFKRARDAGPSRKGRAREQLNAQATAASTVGVIYRVLTERDLVGKDILFDNWLHLCAAITRARGCATYREAEVLRERLVLRDQCTLGELMSDSAIDPALMLAVVARLLQAGELNANLEMEYFRRASLLSRRPT
ncbi:hypothetical protein [Paraburkholderia sp. GAS82]|uniref:hypothetical protein n=1 Tax=Paraburkholderia sp. GAS82 TaxID=3035137 RepID=UPI003D1D789E